MLNRNVSAVVVRLQDVNATILSRVRGGRGEMQSTGGDPDAGEMVVETRSLVANDSVVGTVKVMMTQAYLQADLNQELLSRTLEVICFALLLGFCLYLLFWRLVVKPIKILENYAAAFSTGQAEVRVPRGQYFLGELESLRVWLDRMIELLQARYSALRESEAALRLSDHVLKSISQGVLIAKPDRSIILVNEAFEAMTGYAASEILGQSCRMLQGPLTDAQTLEKIRGALGQANEFSGEILNYRKDGSTFWNELTITPLRDELGRLTHFIGVTRDITSRKESAEALKLSEYKARAVFDHTFQFMGLLDPAGTILEANQPALDFAGIDRSQAVGKPMPETAWWNHSPPLQARVRDAIRRAREGEFIRFEATIPAVDGTPRTIDFSLKPVRDDKGNVIWLIPEGRDVTEQREANNTRESLEAQLRESQKMQAIGTLAGGIAHDFNNILNIILMNADLAKEEPILPQTLECLREIEKASMRAVDLVRQILSFSRRQTTMRKTMALGPVIGEAVRMLRAIMPARVTLEYLQGTGVPPVLADTTQIEQVVINLATNALQAMPTGLGRIEIRLEAVNLDQAMAASIPALGTLHEKHPGLTALICMSDTGSGIDPANLKRIFEPFFTTKPVNEGTGLGLAVVHGIVQTHEGVITVRSQLGNGTTFDVYLPAAATPADRTESNGRAMGNGGERASGRRILYLDDEGLQVTVLRRLLGRRGISVDGHGVAEEALSALKAEPSSFSLVLSDYNMPGMSGLEFAREVRAIRADLPVVVASGFIDETLQAQAKQAGIREIICKPYDCAKFYEMIDRLTACSPDEATDSKRRA